MKKTVKAAALLAAMVLAAGLPACQKKAYAEGGNESGKQENASKVRAQDASPYLFMDGTTVIGFKDGLPANILIPTGVTAIGGYAFYECKRLANVEMPASVTAIGNWAFYKCKSLKSVEIPTSVTAIGTWAFSGCYLENVIIPGSVKTIGESAFSSNDFTSVVIPDGVTAIGKEAFTYCKSLASVEMPASVKTIGDFAFHMCESLKEIKYAGTKAQWEAIKKGNRGASGYVVTCTDGAVRIN